MYTAGLTGPLAVFELAPTVQLGRGYFGLHTRTCFFYVLTVFALLVYVLENRRSQSDAADSEGQAYLIFSPASSGVAGSGQTHLDHSPSHSNSTLGPRHRHKRSGSSSFAQLAPIPDTGEASSDSSEGDPLSRSSSATSGLDSNGNNLLSGGGGGGIPPAQYSPSSSSHHQNPSPFYNITQSYARQAFAPAKWRETPQRWYLDLIFLCVMALFVAMTLVAFLGDARTVVATGYHQPLGDCDNIPVVQRFFRTDFRPKFLCVREPSRFFSLACNEDYATPAFVQPDRKWYRVCGLSDANRVEFTVTVLQGCLLGMILMIHVLRLSSSSLGAKMYKSE